MSHRDAGFTLIELLVALAVFSIAAITLVQLGATTTRASGTVATRTMGQIVAQNIAAEILTDPSPPPLGRATGTTENGGRGWLWSRVTSATADPTIVRIDIVVTDLQRRNAGALTIARKAR